MSEFPRSQGALQSCAISNLRSVALLDADGMADPRSRKSVSDVFAGPQSDESISHLERISWEDGVRLRRLCWKFVNAYANFLLLEVGLARRGHIACAVNLCPLICQCKFYITAPLTNRMFGSDLSGCCSITEQHKSTRVHMVGTFEVLSFVPGAP
jgi:hypothetical protein